MSITNRTQAFNYMFRFHLDLPMMSLLGIQIEPEWRRFGAWGSNGFHGEIISSFSQLLGEKGVEWYSPVSAGSSVVIVYTKTTEWVVLAKLLGEHNLLFATLYYSAKKEINGQFINTISIYSNEN